MFELCVCWGEGGHDAITAKTGRMVWGGGAQDERELGVGNGMACSSEGAMSAYWGGG